LSEKKGKFVPGQRVVGMQVIDAKGRLVGNVRDIGIDVKQKEMALIVVAGDQSRHEVPWTEITSIEDVVLLSKEIEMATPPPSPAPPVARSSTPAVGHVVCPSCRATLPAQAKFCAKCGSRVQ